MISPSFSCQVWTRRIPKMSEEEKDCQDFAAYSREDSRFVVCDGVSNSSLPSTWSRLLGEFFRDQPNLSLSQTFESPELLDDARREWQQIRQQQAKSAWWLSSPSSVGASTIVMATLRGERWFFEAMGDSCVFLWRKGVTGYTLERSYPIQESSSFRTQTACLFSSKETQESRAMRPSSGEEAVAMEGDILFLATDALSKWLLDTENETERQQRFEQCMEWVQDPNVFQEQIDAERESRRMEDDDVTLVVVAVKQNTISEEIQSSVRFTAPEDPASLPPAHDALPSKSQPPQPIPSVVRAPAPSLHSKNSESSASNAPAHTHPLETKSHRDTSLERSSDAPMVPLPSEHAARTRCFATGLLLGYLLCSLSREGG